MRPAYVGSPPMSGTDGQKLDWCIKAILEIARCSKVENPNHVADAYLPSNVTDTRDFDADTATVAEVADVLGTFIQDLKARGTRRG
mgnify:CR=1 FL=1|jgi:hypothetical protein